MTVRHRYIRRANHKLLGHVDPHVEIDPDNWAHGVWTALAATLAEPLRRAFDEHIVTHGCAERHGFAYCDEAMALFRLLPDGDTIIVA